MPAALEMVETDASSRLPGINDQGAKTRTGNVSRGLGNLSNAIIADRQMPFGQMRSVVDDNLRISLGTGKAYLIALMTSS